MKPSFSRPRARSNGPAAINTVKHRGVRGWGALVLSGAMALAALAAPVALAAGQPAVERTDRTATLQTGGQGAGQDRTGDPRQANQPEGGTQAFADVPPTNPFYFNVQNIYNDGIVNGYPCGGPNEPCVPPASRPYFRPNAGATRGQLTKIVSNAAGFDDQIPAAQQTFTDVAPGSTFWLYIERLLANRPDAIAGYPCGGPNEPCDSENRPYFRLNNGVTRGQASKIVSNTFFPECSPP